MERRAAAWAAWAWECSFPLKFQMSDLKFPLRETKADNLKFAITKGLVTRRGLFIAFEFTIPPAMDNQLPLPIGTLLQARYQLTAALGSGGFGRVYRATDQRLDAEVAIKELIWDGSQSGRETFKREAKHLRNLDHPGLPKSSDFFNEMGRWFLVMDFVEGDDLNTLLKAHGTPFEPLTVLRWAEQILNVLEYLHNKGLVHRDIKPANIKIVGGNRLKVLDLGIAKGAVGDITTVHTGTVAAVSRPYAALDQLVRFNSEAHDVLQMYFPDRVAALVEQKTDGRCDLYSLGATLYELSTARCPIPANIRALGDWTGKPQDLIGLTHLESDLRGVIEKAIALEATDRYQTASKMLGDVRDVLAQRTNPPHARSLEQSLAEGDIDLFKYLTTKYPSVASPKAATKGGESALLEKFGEQVRRAELLGFFDLLNDLKGESLTISQESVDRLARMIDVEIKIERDIERKEIENRWEEARTRVRRPVRRASEDRAKRQAEFKDERKVREEHRRQSLTVITVAVLGTALLIGAIAFYFGGN